MVVKHSHGTSMPGTKTADYAAGVGAVIVTKDEDFTVRRLLADGSSKRSNCYRQPLKLANCVC